MSSGVNAAPIPGRRETKKREKAERIRAAATSLFHKRGYRETTIGAIAAAAKIAPGTLFLYAADKRELLLLIINDELDVLTADAFGGVDPAAPLLDQLMHVFAPRYAYWGVDPELSLFALQEVLVAQPGDERPGSQFGRYARRRDQLVAGIVELLTEQQRRGRIRADDDPRAVANLCMAIHLSVVRSWLRRRGPATGDGVAELRELLRLAIRGSLMEPA